ncbi:uncharacterized protein LOC21406841 isoform X2 [Morus notabilis]|uniref:uncharacterized protein LOC21406841 isoform X2 n=1 Tax=Morus notabilis TaxID=981085 RepID=UPI000CED6965|nr:uncharacterized protein LOC21406841 isoform X2 [Morus notabilis]
MEKILGLAYLFVLSTGVLRVLLIGTPVLSDVDYQVPRRTRTKQMHHYLQQVLLGDNVLCMTILSTLTRIYQLSTEPLWRKILSSCSCVCSKRSRCALSLRGRWAALRVLYLLGIGILLLRNIFENCVSRPPSEQNSSMTSPALPKHESRKHPSIISSAFCSSKKFPFRPWQALVSIDGSGKRSTKTGHVHLSNGRNDTDSVKSCSGSNKVPAAEKASILRTLRDHLHQCPSKLSEEMVRCMAIVCYWLRGTASVSTEKNRSPFLSRSSTNVIQPRRGVGDDQDWSGQSMVEILWISTDKSQFSHASCAINNYRVLVEQLERINVSQMETNAQTAFWINVYNALIMHAYLAYGIPNSSLRRLALFHKAAYNIGGRVISANAIEQSIFCFRTPRIGWWLETILSAALRKKSGEDRRLSSKFGLPNSQTLVCFALCSGAFSDPMLRVYSASNVREELEEAKKEFLQANVVVKKSRKVFLPKMLERFAREASFGSEDLLKWVAGNVDKKLHDSIQKCLGCKSSKKASQIMEWLPYSSRFRYVLSKDLTEKPWWV